MVRIGACVVRVAGFSPVVYIAVQTNVARNAFRGFAIVPQYMASFDTICPGPIFDLSGVFVLITVWHLRFDIFAVFVARQL